MRIHHLNCGTIAPLGRGRINRSILPWRAVCHCLLIETDHDLVLVDTGIGVLDIEDPNGRLGWDFRWGLRPVLTPEETAAHQVRALGYQVEDVRHIVITHLDVDHIGGLSDFPDAQVHLYARELAAARNPVTRLERRRYRRTQWSHGPHWVEHASIGEPWFGFDAVRDLPGLPSELLLIPLAGHTHGHAGIAVDTGRTDRPRWLLHAGDAYIHHGQVDPISPHCPPLVNALQLVLQADMTTRLHNVQRLQELASNDSVEIISAHDPHYFDRAVSPKEYTHATP